VAADYDVIVNSTGRKIVDGGASCRAILAAAGPSVRDDIVSKYPKEIDPSMMFMFHPKKQYFYCLKR